MAGKWEKERQEREGENILASGAVFDCFDALITLGRKGKCRDDA